MIIVSDVCDTLFYSNTTIDYCGFVLRKQGRVLPAIILKLSVSKKSPLFYFLAILSRLCNFDFAKFIAVYFLKGILKSDLDKYADNFVSQELRNRKIDKVFSLIAQYKNARLILLSSSLDPVVSAIAKSFSAEFASSQLGYIQGVCSGKIYFEMKGRKLEILKKNFQKLSSDIIVISDNASDWELMSYAKEKYAVVYNDKQKKFWHKLNANIIEA
ncbi:MAG: hypothetical protein K2X86_13525 [Cytophagaceae bacterium]|nr:hypothetical protein [Cytophagaceae bacterium]